MNEAQTRLDKIDPKLRDAGWGIVPGSKILVEQSAYIAPGRITTTGHKNPKKADYILEGDHRVGSTDHFSALKIWMFENKFVSLPSHLKTIEPMEVHRESRTMCNTETSKSDQ